MTDHQLTHNTVTFDNAVRNIMNRVRFEKEGLFETYLDGKHMAVVSDGESVSLHHTRHKDKQAGKWLVNTPVRKVAVTETMTAKELQKILIGEVDSQKPPQVEPRIRRRRRG